MGGKLEPGRAAPLDRAGGDEVSESVIFVAVFGGMFVLRLIAATVVFFFLMPRGDRCPLCDAPTIRVMHRVWNRIAPFYRTSWCPGCGWEGLLRHGPLSDPPVDARVTTGARAEG